MVFIHGGDTDMVFSQLLRALEVCVEYHGLFSTSSRRYCGIYADRSCKIQVTIAYSLLHLTR